MTGPCTAHVWLVAVARCDRCGDSLCSTCRAPLGGIDGTSRCVDCAAAELDAATDRRRGLQKLFRRRPAPAALIPVEPIPQPNPEDATIPDAPGVEVLGELAPQRLPRRRPPGPEHPQPVPGARDRGRTGGGGRVAVVRHRFQRRPWRCWRPAGARQRSPGEKGTRPGESPGRHHDMSNIATGTEPQLVVDSDGNRRWILNDGRMHREDGPAYEGVDGTQAWYRHGNLHREDGPAFLWADGTVEWFYGNTYHRVGGPAFDQPGLVTRWYHHGIVHRVDGPAEVPYDPWAEPSWYLWGTELTRAEATRFAAMSPAAREIAASLWCELQGGTAALFDAAEALAAEPAAV